MGGKSTRREVIMELRGSVRVGSSWNLDDCGDFVVGVFDTLIPMKIIKTSYINRDQIIVKISILLLKLEWICFKLQWACFYNVFGHGRVDVFS